MALPDRALQVLDLLIQRGLGERPLLFICHSLGGLLAKQLLRKSSDAGDARKQRLARSTRAVLFLATPHAGAVLADLANEFRTLFGATVTIEELRAHDPYLRDLFNWYRQHAPKLSIITATYYESRRGPGMPIIVNPTSAHPGVGEDPVALDETHTSIAKPYERDAQVCWAASALLRNHVLAVLPRQHPQAPVRETADELLAKLAYNLALPRPLTLPALYSALDASMAATIWARLDKGESGFLRPRIYSHTGQILFEEIRSRSAIDAAFCTQLTSVVEEVATTLARWQHAPLLVSEVSIFQQSGIGRMYLFLSHALGRIR